MTGFPAVLAGMIAALGVGMTLIGRSWPARPKHRGARRPRRVEEYVPGHVLIPALAGETFAHHRDHATTGD